MMGAAPYAELRKDGLVQVAQSEQGINAKKYVEMASELVENNVMIIITLMEMGAL
jgi:hypothetical protein